MTSFLINSSEDFKKLCDRLRGSPYVAIDTEFMRSRSYWAELCLLQLSDEGNVNRAVVDCLVEGIDLSPLGDILSDSSIVKVFHGARQDIEILYHRFGFMPLPLFDTQIGAMACGFGDQIGYDALVRKALGVDVDKTQRLKDWSKRPLRRKDLEYALGDVTHLTRAYEYILDYLVERDRLSWVEDEMVKLTLESSYDFSPENSWLRLKLRGSREYLSILRELAILREREAQERNLPRNFVIKDDALYSIASNRPRSHGDLKDATSIYGKRYKGDLADELLRAVRRGIERVDDLPEFNFASKKIESSVSLDLLKMVLKIVSEDSGVSPRLVADNDDLLLLVRGFYKGCRVMSGWRYDIFGRYAEKLLSGHLSLALEKGRLCLRDIDILGED